MAAQDYSPLITDIKTAPHNIPTDGSANPAQTTGADAHAQFPFAELAIVAAASASSGTVTPLTFGR